MENNNGCVIRDSEGNEYISSSALWPVFQELFARYVERPPQSVLRQFERGMAQTAAELGVYWPDSECDLEKVVGPDLRKGVYLDSALFPGPNVQATSLQDGQQS
jgi:hypothetical protein